MKCLSIVTVLLACLACGEIYLPPTDWAGWPKENGTGLAPDCGEITSKGTCTGAVVSWCEEGALQTVDCMADGYDGCALVGDIYNCYKVLVDSPANSQSAPQGQDPCEGVACDDGNACTKDTCWASGGGCMHVPVANGSACGSDSLCTFNDMCKAGFCTGQKKCDDKDPCTNDACDPGTGQCNHEDNPNCGSVCGNGNCEPPFETQFTCSKDCGKAFLPNSCMDKCGGQGSGFCWCDSACVKNSDCCSDIEAACGNTTSVQNKNNPGTSCDDANGCTTDSYHLSGCKHVPNNMACDTGTGTGDLCLIDRCVGDVCIGDHAPACNDDNPCTDDQCNKDNGDCTYATQYANGLTLDGLSGPAVCGDDGNPCTKESCLGGKCVTSPIPDGVACIKPDKDPAAHLAACKQGVCYEYVD